jgi:chemotaxis protein methyltransferase CheR
MDLAPFKTLIRERCGLTLEGIGPNALASGVRKRCTATASAGPAYLNLIKSDEKEFNELVSLLTVNETYFYREPEQLLFAVNTLVPRLLLARRDGAPLRILSAGCSSGEELYSLAIALSEQYGAAAAHQFWLAGGDIDEAALAKARSGRYTEFSFRTLAPDLRTRYFERLDKTQWTVREPLRSRVHFHHLNLLAASYPAPFDSFDIIFFRNVSIYFDEPGRRRALQQLAALLSPQGVLIMGSAETLSNDLGVLPLVAEQGLFYFSRAGGAPARAAPPPPAPAGKARPAPARTNPAKPHAPVVADGGGRGRRALAEAKALIRDKQFERAQACLDGLGDTPSASLLLRAFLALQRKQYGNAEQLALHVVEQDAWDIDALMVLALTARFRDQADAAVKWLKQAVYACPQCWPAHYYLAEYHRAAHQVDAARRGYRVTLQLLAECAPGEDGLKVIPLALPASELRFLCQHQLSLLDGATAPKGG